MPVNHCDYREFLHDLVEHRQLAFRRGLECLPEVRHGLVATPLAAQTFPDHQLSPCGFGDVLVAYPCLERRRVELARIGVTPVDKFDESARPYTERDFALVTEGLGESKGLTRV